MRVIVAGAGEIGWYVAEQISACGHDVTLIEKLEEKVRHAESNLDVRVIHDSAASAHVLISAGVAETDLFVAATGSDETNLVCASIAKKLGAAQSIARVDEVVYRKAPEISYQDHFGIDDMLSPEMLTALELASVVRNPGVLAVEHFARGALEMQQFYADRGAKYVGKQLFQMEVPDNVRIACIQRGSTLIIPRGNDRVEHDDQVILIGKTDQVSLYRAGFESVKPKVTKVVIMGGGHTTLSLARRLRRRGYLLTIFERNKNRCRQLAGILPEATIIHGDGTNLSLLKEERIDNADYFISTTDNDEANIMSAMQAKNLGVKQVLVMIHRPDYANLMERMGIDRAISPRAVMARDLLSMLRKGKESTLAILGDGEAEILELAVEGEDFVGLKLRELKMPGESLVLTFQRNGEVTVPHADTEFQLDDRVLVICRPDDRKKLIKLIVGSG